jgi:hypothetical protein
MGPGVKLPAIAPPLLLASAGLIHLLPLPGVLGAEWLQRLYGVSVDDSDLVLLLRHRAVMFGLLGALLLAAARRPALRAPALLAGIVSTAAFLLLAGDPTALGPALRRVWLADVAALACLALAAIAARRNERQKNLR